MSAKNVNLKISNKQYYESLEPEGEAFRRELSLEDEIEIMTEAKLYKKPNATFITYDEPVDTGFDNSKTVIKLEDDVLSIRRYGGESEGHMDLTLQEGAMSITTYVIPMARIEIEVYTNGIQDELSEEGYGKIFADYNVRIADFSRTRNKLEIDITKA